MCLTLRYGLFSKFKRYAFSDIECYKFVRVVYKTYNQPTYCSPYRGFIYEIGEEYSSDIGKVEHNQVHEGLHTCPHFNDAKALVGNVMNDHRGKGNAYTILKCLIPKGTWYYKGWFANRESFVSEKLLVVEDQQSRLYPHPLEDAFIEDAFISHKKKRNIIKI